MTMLKQKKSLAVNNITMEDGGYDVIINIRHQLTFNAVNFASTIKYLLVFSFIPH